MLIRLNYVDVQGYPGDVRLFMDWGQTVARGGPGAFYRPDYFADYPPAYLWVLGLFAKLFDGEALRLVVKGASIPADVGLALSFAALLWNRAGPGRAALAAWLWMLAPGAPPTDISFTRKARSSGMKTSSTTTVLLPVPFSPIVNQSSTIV